MFSNGKAHDLLKMFSGRQEVTDSPVARNISGGFIDNLVNKFGLDLHRNTARNVSGNLMPSVLKGLVNKTNDPNDSSFNIQDIFNKLSVGSTSGFNETCIGWRN